MTGYEHARDISDVDFLNAVTRKVTFTAEGMLMPRSCPVGRRLWLRVRRRSLPQPVQPPGTVPLAFEYQTDDGHRMRIFIPAARIQDAVELPSSIAVFGETTE